MEKESRLAVFFTTGRFLLDENSVIPRYYTARGSSEYNIVLTKNRPWLYLSTQNNVVFQPNFKAAGKLKAAFIGLF